MAGADDLILGVDRALRALTGQTRARRPNPADAVTPDPAATASGAVADPSNSASHGANDSANLMRVNHTGEICAQALYEGQALTARDPVVRQRLRQAADEEADHLAWCEDRLEELDARSSIFNPLFYGMSFAMGAVTGLLGDRISLGFVEATEDEVCKHLDRHLAALPEDDVRTRVIIETMKADEARHGSDALAAGGAEFPPPVKRLMALVSRVMTETAYRG